jgi:cell division ATPase FtsA
MYYVGIDIGTHQSKICLKDTSGNPKIYTYVSVQKHSFAIPSIVQINSDNTVSYGIVEEEQAKISDSGDKLCFRYFKMAVYDITYYHRFIDNYHTDPILVSVVYFIYLMYRIEEIVGVECSYQYGIPSSYQKNEIEKNQSIAWNIVNKGLEVKSHFKSESEFLSCSWSQLVKMIQSILDLKGAELEDKMDKFGFMPPIPESLSAVKCILSQKFINKEGFYLLVDIGGGTTDVALFNLCSKQLDMPTFLGSNSFPLGLNNVYEIYGKEKYNKSDLSINDIISIQREFNNGSVSKEYSVKAYNYFVNALRSSIIKANQYLLSELRCLNKDEWKDELKHAIENKPIIYTGGGSIIQELTEMNLPYFKDKVVVDYSVVEGRIHFSEKVDIDSIKHDFPILAIAYGLTEDILEQPQISDPRTLFAGLPEKQRSHHDSSYRAGGLENQSRVAQAIMKTDYGELFLTNRSLKNSYTKKKNKHTTIFKHIGSSVKPSDFDKIKINRPHKAIDKEDVTVANQMKTYMILDEKIRTLLFELEIKRKSIKDLRQFTREVQRTFSVINSCINKIGFNYVNLKTIVADVAKAKKSFSTFINLK